MTLTTAALAQQELAAEKANRIIEPRGEGSLDGIRPGDEVVSALMMKNTDRASLLERLVAQGMEFPVSGGSNDEPEALWNAEFFGDFKKEREMIARRDMFTKHFGNTDGSITAITAAGPMHYQKNGQWKTIFTTLEPYENGGFANERNYFKTYYPALAGGVLMTVLPDGSSLSGMGNMRLYFTADNQVIDEKVLLPVQGLARNNVMTYDGAFGSGTELRVTQHAMQHKIDVILGSAALLQAGVASGATHLVLEETVTLPSGVQAEKKEQRIILMRNGKPIAAFEPPVVYEAESPSTEDGTPILFAEYELLQAGQNLVIKTLVPMAWLTAVGRAFPVTIDPTVTVFPDNDVFWTQLGGQNGTGGNDMLAVGRGNLGTGFTNWRSSIKFNVASIPTDATIDDLSISYYIDLSVGWETSTNRFVRFRQTTTDPIGWPTWTSVFTNSGSGTQYAQTATAQHATADVWRSLDLGAAARTYLQNTSLSAGWFGIGLDYGGSGYTGNNNRLVMFAPHSSANRPYLTVTYTSACDEPTPAGTLTADKSSTVSNDVLMYEVSGGQGLVGYDVSWDNFDNFEFIITNDNTLSVHVFPNDDRTLYVRSVHIEGGCPEGFSNTVTTDVSCSSVFYFGTSDGDYITNVTFGSIDNNSTTDYDSGPDAMRLRDAYQDFTHLSTEVCRGGTYSLAVSGTTTFGQPQGFAAWIDWNNDGVFESSENVLLSAPTTTAIAQVTVPLNAVSGPVKMRVLCAWNTTPQDHACAIVEYGYGEIEEYTIDIASCTYYAVETGNAHDAVWNTDPSATVGTLGAIAPTSNFVIRNGQTITFINNFTCNNLTIENVNGEGAMVIDGDPVLTMYGNLSHSGGQLDTGEGTFLFNAGTPQTISSPANLYNITVNNQSGVSLTENLAIRGVLQIDQGDFTASPYLVRLISNATRTGGIGSIATGSSYIGEVIHERYIPPGIQFWMNICNPILGKTLSDWNATLVTTGFPGSNWPNNSFVNIKQYDETVPGLLNEGFTDPASVNDPLDAVFGYLVYLTAAAQFTTATGGFHQGGMTVPLNYTSTGVPQNDGWELMANIYPCEVSWEEIYAASEGIGATYYIYDAENASYIGYTAELGLGMHSGFIPSGQSFWVQTVQNSAYLQWEETHKSNEGTQFERDVNPDISFVSMAINTPGKRQEAYLVFEDGMTHGYDPGDDAINMGTLSTTAPELSWRATGGEKLMLSRVPKVFQNVEVMLHMNIKSAGTYTLTVDETQNLPEFTCMYFEDLETGDVYSLEAGEVITLTFAEPFNGDRFALHVNAPVTASAAPPSCFNSEDAIIEVELQGNGSFDLTLVDAFGVTVSSQPVNEVATFSGLPAGSYTVIANSDDQICQAMMVHVEVTAPDEPIIDVLTTTPWCNEAGAAELEVLASGAGNFSVNLFDQMNTPIFTQTMEAGGIDITNLNPGTYQVVVNHQCTNQVFDFVLEDENTVLAQALFNNQVSFENNAAIIEADALCVNATGWTWYVNGIEVASGGNLQYSITNQGSYTVELVAFNDSCTDSFIFEVTTTTVTYVQNSETDDFKLGMTSESVMLWVPAHDAPLLIDLFDIQGRLILQDQLPAGSPRRIDIPTGAMAVGSYILKVTGENVNRSWTIQAHK